MDELEISGKRYISSRRAGKEHKYHPDYIGQLVRAGKVEGQKVGRAWYVDADSLAKYLSQDLGPRAPIAAIANVVPKVEEKIVVAEEIQEPIAHVDQMEIRQVLEEPAAFEQEEKIHIRTEVPIKRKTGGLTYIADDAPLFPAIKKNSVPMTTYPARSAAAVEDVEEYREEPIHILSTPRAARVPMSRAGMLRAGLSLVVLGCASFAIAAFISTNLIISISVKEGQPASIEYSIK